MPKAKETVLEIDLKALEHNYYFLKSKLNSNTKFLAVVKAFAYGSDSAVIAEKLQELDVDYFAVAYANEGVVLRDAGITKPILVLHPQPINFKTLIERCLEPSLYSAKVLKEFIAVAEAENQKDYPVHIKFNTGLNRLGFWESDITYVSEQLNKTIAVKAISVFSHLAASEDSNESEFTKTQISNFKAIANDLSLKLGYRLWCHLCNTSGVLNYPEAHFDMVRCGIGLYGFGNASEYNTQLKPIATLKSVISQIHKIEPNESVGYNRAYISKGYEKTATIPIGHADGISRQFGQEKGMVFINGRPAPIVGNVCMDMIMVNVSNINCSEGDEVIVFGGHHSASDFALSANTISYEVLTAVSQRVKRIIVKC